MNLTRIGDFDFVHLSLSKRRKAMTGTVARMTSRRPWKTLRVARGRNELGMKPLRRVKLVGAAVLLERLQGSLILPSSRRILTSYTH